MVILNRKDEVQQRQIRETDSHAQQTYRRLTGYAQGGGGRVGESSSSCRSSGTMKKCLIWRSNAFLEVEQITYPWTGLVHVPYSVSANKHIFALGGRFSLLDIKMYYFTCKKCLMTITTKTLFFFFFLSSRSRTPSTIFYLMNFLYTFLMYSRSGVVFWTLSLASTAAFQARNRGSFSLASLVSKKSGAPSTRW